jgi:hypothetical protein
MPGGISIAKIRSLFADNDGFGLVALVGVQSNQFPRALDIARPLRADGVPVTTASQMEKKRCWIASSINWLRWKLKKREAIVARPFAP